MQNMGLPPINPVAMSPIYKDGRGRSPKESLMTRPPWDNRAHMTFSKGNHKYHTQFKQFFDKNYGEHQYNDSFKYIFKTPSNG